MFLEKKNQNEYNFPGKLCPNLVENHIIQRYANDLIK